MQCSYSASGTQGLLYPFKVDYKLPRLTKLFKRHGMIETSYMVYDMASYMVWQQSITLCIVTS